MSDLDISDKKRAKGCGTPPSPSTAAMTAMRSCSADSAPGNLAEARNECARLASALDWSAKESAWIGSCKLAPS